ncbi:MAG: hypothetical protein P4K93_07545 [Terracidiphilus sp.]|nr:hypothetical protein [Terracidiphilus sp.]
MLTPGYVGPKEQWQAELQNVNKFGLLSFIDILMAHLDAWSGGMDRASLLKTVRRSKQYGEWDAAEKRHERFMANPTKAVDEMIRGSRAAKRAARRKKRGR